MILVVATSAGETLGVRLRLAEHDGVGTIEVVAPSESRRLVLAAMDDEREAARLAAALRSEGRSAVIRPDGGPQLDAWMRDTSPVEFGERLSVCFAWSEHDRTDLPGLVELGPSGFGNGRHPSTRLLVEQLLHRITGGERVLDVGCGSGVLGLCALRLGASRVVAVDVQEDAVHATRRNAALNGLDGRVEAVHGPLAEVGGVFGVVVANVGRSALVELAPHLARLVEPGGWLAASGISASQCTQVAGFLRPLVELERHTAGEWSSLVLAHGVRSCQPPETAASDGVTPGERR